MRFGVIVLAAAALPALPAQAAELVTNGTFSAGSSGYSTQYAGTDADGYQYLTNNPRSVCDCFANIDGSTNGHGNQLVLDGAQNGGYFFQQTLSIVAGTTYTFSFDAANLGTAGPIPNIAAFVNGVQLFMSGELPYDDAYRTYSGNFSAGSATSAIITLRDLTLAHSYNDFAIDNVSFTGSAAAVPEPATWAMMLVGFGMIGFAARKRLLVKTTVSYA